MYEARIEFSIGSISFTGEGDKEWVSSQLDKILSKSHDLVNISHSVETNLDFTSVDENQKQHANVEVKNDISLPLFLEQHNAKSVQVQKFLVTAYWLTLKGNKSLKPGDISLALKNSAQNKLTNASDCLAKNVKKGFCERDGDKFFVTSEGISSLSSK